MINLSGKVAIITGGSRGIGAATARKLAEAGADIAITFQSTKVEADTVVTDILGLGRKAISIRADAGDASQIVSAVEQTATQLGPIDILVNNAGVGSVGPLDTVSIEEVDRVLNTNTRGAYVTTKATTVHMNDGGRIVNIGSGLSLRVPGPGMTLYAMSKSALIGMTKGLAHDLASRNITVNLLNLGSVDTDMNPADGPYAEFLNTLTPLGRYATPEEIARTIAFIASPECTYLTGACISVDGGFTA